MNLTDIVRVRSTGKFARIDGFYRLETHPGWGTILRPCLHDDPNCAAVSTTAIAGEFHRPFDLLYDGPVGWTNELVQEDFESWALQVSESRLWDCLSERDYPGITEPFANLSNHEKLELERWRIDQAAAAKTRVGASA